MKVVSGNKSLFGAKSQQTTGGAGFPGCISAQSLFRVSLSLLAHSDNFAGEMVYAFFF